VTARFRLEGRVAFVTGSSRGLGRAMAFSLAQSGAKVALNWCNDETSASQTFEEFQREGHEGILLRGNAIDEDDIGAMLAETAGRLGPVDVAVANATPDQPHRPIEEYDWAFYQSMLDYFVKSPFLLTQAVLPHMKAQRWGRIVQLGSETFQLGQPDFTAYVAAKGAQNGFTRSLARELAPWGITVNMVSPGWIPTERHADDPPELKDAYVRALPSKRWGLAREVGDTVAFLATDEASYVSGQNIAVNGANTVA
jgi:3-oxoacyl-[acyl-carrier protein] reductase